MAMAAMYHGASYIGQARASTISTMRYALVDHCVHSVTLYRLTACSFLCAFHTYTPTSKGVVTSRTLSLIQGYNRAHIKRPTAQAHAIKGPKGPQKSVLGLGCHSKLWVCGGLGQGFGAV